MSDVQALRMKLCSWALASKYSWARTAPGRWAYCQCWKGRGLICCHDLIECRSRWHETVQRPSWEEAWMTCKVITTVEAMMPLQHCDPETISHYFHWAVPVEVGESFEGISDRWHVCVKDKATVVVEAWATQRITKFPGMCCENVQNVMLIVVDLFEWMAISNQV